MKKSSHHAPRDESGNIRESSHSRPDDESSPLHDPALITPGVVATLFATGDGKGLRLELLRQSDRYSHRIVSADGTPLLTSIEGSDQDVWPPSPPLQQLSIEEIRPGVEVALLVGMAGKSHWSVSIEPLADKCGFVFDVACRLREAAGWLGSSYTQPVSAPPSLKLGSLPIDTLPSSCDIEDLPSNATITPVTPVSQGRGTVRWKYCVGLSR